MVEIGQQPALQHPRAVAEMRRGAVYLQQDRRGEVADYPGHVGGRRELCQGQAEPGAPAPGRQDFGIDRGDQGRGGKSLRRRCLFSGFATAAHSA